MKTKPLGPAPCKRGDIVEVRPERIRPYRGTVTAVKPSQLSGWYVELRRHDDEMTWHVSADLVTVIETEGGE
jgi:hypothetical protein